MESTNVHNTTVNNHVTHSRNKRFILEFCRDEMKRLRKPRMFFFKELTYFFLNVFFTAYVCKYNEHFYKRCFCFCIFLILCSCWILLCENKIGTEVYQYFVLVQDLFKGFEENFDTLNSKSQNCQSDFWSDDIYMFLKILMKFIFQQNMMQNIIILMAEI